MFPGNDRSANYLSGGQSLEDAAARLDAINKKKTARDPWNLSFSWSAALQMPLFELCRRQRRIAVERDGKIVRRSWKSPVKPR